MELGCDGKLSSVENFYSTYDLLLETQQQQQQ